MRVVWRREGAASVWGVFLACATAWGQRDRIVDVNTGWGYLYGATTADITAQMGAGSRPFNIERIASNSYDTIVVSNSGSYAVTGANVLYGQTSASLASAMNAAGTRLLDLEPYDNGGTFFSAIVVPNSGGTAAPGWGWVAGVTFNDIVNWVNTTPNLRLIDLDAYSSGGQTLYSAVGVPNTGSNFQAGWWYASGATAAQVSADLATNGARLIDIEVESVGTIFSPTVRYAYIAVSDNPGLGVWATGLTSQGVADFVAQYGTRLTCLDRYVDAFGQTRWVAAAVDNAGSQTRRIRNIMLNEPGLGNFGFRLKEVGGPALASLNENFVWEPASTVKLLHGVYAIWKCSLPLSTEDLTDLVEYRNIFDPGDPEFTCGLCAFDWSCPPEFIDLEETIRLMLEPSNNNALIALEHRYGVPTLNQFADDKGFGNIAVFRQDCQCAVVLNTATCTDICGMLEQVADGSLFSRFWQDTLYRLMNDLDSQGWALYPTLSAIIDDEAAATSLTQPEIDAFREAVRYANKGGSYDCGEFYRTEGAWASLPFKVQLLGVWTVVHREYTIAAFSHNASVDASAAVVHRVKEEILREQVREALQSWDDACDTPFVFDPPDALTVQEGEDAVFTATIAGGQDDPAFQWQKRAGDLAVNLTDAPGQFAGTHTDTLTILGAAPVDAGEYRLSFSSVCGAVATPWAMLTVTPPPACPGDANGDGLVTFADITSVLQNWGENYAPNSGPGDADGGGIVDFADVTSVLQHWGEACP
jgi:hypothetical protein